MKTKSHFTFWQKGTKLIPICRIHFQPCIFCQVLKPLSYFLNLRICRFWCSLLLFQNLLLGCKIWKVCTWLYNILPDIDASKVKKIIEDSLNSIPSPLPSVKIEIMGGKVGLRCKGKTLLGVVNKSFAQKVCWQ